MSFAGPRSAPVRAVLASSILPHFLVVRRTIFTVAPRTSGSRADGGQWNDGWGLVWHNEEAQMRCGAGPKGRFRPLQRWQDPSSAGQLGPSVALNHDWLVDS